MADVTVSAKIANLADRPRRRNGAGRAGLGHHRASVLRLSRLRRRPRRRLDQLGFGRAHHRVLHFVNRNPGMKVADLLDILNITKQSLGRVLKQLVDKGYVVQKRRRAGPPPAAALRDAEGPRRWRSSSPACRRVRIDRTLRRARARRADEAARRFLTAMIDATIARRVLRLIARADRAGKAR